MSLRVNFELMATYNRWINEQVYKAARQLPNDVLVQDKGAFFNSILGTLNHIMVGDLIWLQRFAEHPSHFLSLDDIRLMTGPATLDTMLFNDIAKLQEARVKVDDCIYDFVIELTDTVLSSSLDYYNTQGEAQSRPLAQLIQHFFNHQTHHRGQVTTLLSQSGIDVGVTDLLACIPQAK